MNKDPILEKQSELAAFYGRSGDDAGLALLHLMVTRAVLGNDLSKKQAGVNKEGLPKKSKIQTFKSIMKLVCTSLSTAVHYKKQVAGHERIAHYMILPRKMAGGESTALAAYDKRSRPVLEVMPPQKSLNIIHCRSVKEAAETINDLDNPFYFEAVARVLYVPALLVSLFLSLWMRRFMTIPDVGFKQEWRFRARILSHKWILTMLLLYVKPRKILMIDDARHTLPLRRAAKKIGAETIFYMHGRFNKFHVGLFHETPDHYLMWSEYYRDLFLRHVPSGVHTKIHLCGAYHLKGQDLSLISKKNKDNVLLVIEDNVNYTDIIPFLNKIIENSSVKLRFKAKTLDVDPFLQEFARKYGVSIVTDGSLFECCCAHQIAAVIGTHSTALLESWLIGVPSVIMDCGLAYARHMFEDELSIVAKNPNSVRDALEQACQMSAKEIENKRQKLWSWGECKALGESDLPAILRMIIKP